MEEEQGESFNLGLPLNLISKTPQDNNFGNIHSVRLQNFLKN